MDSSQLQASGGVIKLKTLSYQQLLFFEFFISGFSFKPAVAQTQQKNTTCSLFVSAQFVDGTTCKLTELGLGNEGCALDWFSGFYIAIERTEFLVVERLPIHIESDSIGIPPFLNKQ